MAKKLIIKLLSNPTVGQILKYESKINGVLIPYNLGANKVDITFSNNASRALEVNIKPTLNATLVELFNVLNVYYSYSIINYSVVGDTIEVLFNNDNVTIDNIIEPISIDVTYSDISTNTEPTLYYFMEYLDPMNIPYKVNIYKRNNSLAPRFINGYATLETGSVKDNLDPIRGSGLTLNLEATLDLNLEDLYTDDENQFIVKFYRNNELLFNGFLKPDGVFQSFVSDRWVISLECVDGLGILKDLSFVKENGLHFIGKMRAIDVIYNCLKRTNVSMDLNTSVNIYYDGLVPSNVLDPLHEVYVSADRFVKTDKDTIMDCQEVLKSILTLFKASITQHNGEWYIYRSNELSVNSIVNFRQYSKVDNSYIGINSRNLTKSLGSQINGKYPHHANGNQQIEIKGSVSAFRVNYKYGFIAGTLENPNLLRNGTDYYYWEELNMTNVIFDPLRESGIIFSDVSSGLFPLSPIIKSNPFPFLANEQAQLKVAFKTYSLNEGAVLYFRIKQGVNYLLYDGLSNTVNEWTTNNQSVARVPIYSIEKVDNVFTFDFPPFLANGDLTVELIQPSGLLSPRIIFYVDLIDVINITKTNQGAQGEFHTVQRQNRPSSIAKDTEEIFNGDSPSIIYQGAIFKSDKVTPTTKWFRRNQIESKPILQIIGEDVLRMSQKPAKLFSGDVYGYIPYLSVVTIDSIEGKFMAIEHTFDSKTNITSCKFLQLMDSELTDIKYKLTFDYGNVTKTTITS